MKDEEYYQFTNSCYIKKASANKSTNDAVRLRAKEKSLELKESALKATELRLIEKENELELKENALKATELRLIEKENELELKENNTELLERKTRLEGIK